MIGISANAPFSQKAFADFLKLNFAILSDDPDLKTIAAYGVLNRQSRLAQRPYFIVDKAGLIRYHRGRNQKASMTVFAADQPRRSVMAQAHSLKIDSLPVVDRGNGIQTTPLATKGIERADHQRRYAISCRCNRGSSCRARSGERAGAWTKIIALVNCVSSPL